MKHGVLITISVYTWLLLTNSIVQLIIRDGWILKLCQILDVVMRRIIPGHSLFLCVNVDYISQQFNTIGIQDKALF